MGEKTKSHLPSAGASQAQKAKNAGKHQHQREKKKMSKLEAKKAKQAKRTEILKSLAENAIQDQKIMDSLVSAKNMASVGVTAKAGKKRPRKNQEDLIAENEEEKAEPSPTKKEAEKITVSKPVAVEPMAAPVVAMAAEPQKSEPKPEETTLAEKWAEIQQKCGVELAAAENAMRDVQDDDELKDAQAEKNKLSEDLQEIVRHFKRPKKIIQVDRIPEIAKSRKALPIIMEEQELMEAIEGNLVTVVSGETGSGKSTQIPQFLYERGYSFEDSINPGRIGITQPRRIAAISLSQRVSQELNVTHGKEVGYQIRYDSAFVSEKTQIKVL